MNAAPMRGQLVAGGGVSFIVVSIMPCGDGPQRLSIYTAPQVKLRFKAGVGFVEALQFLTPDEGSPLTQAMRFKSGMIPSMVLVLIADSLLAEACTSDLSFECLALTSHGSCHPIPAAQRSGFHAIRRPICQVEDR